MIVKQIIGGISRVFLPVIREDNGIVPRLPDFGQAEVLQHSVYQEDGAHAGDVPLLGVSIRNASGRSPCRAFKNSFAVRNDLCKIPKKD